MIVGIDIRDAAAARRNPIQYSRIERFEECQYGAGRADLLQLGQLVRFQDLTGGDDILHPRDHKGNDGHGLAHASRLGDHADLDDLRLDLVETRKQPVLARGVRDQDARCPGNGRRLHDVPDPQDELVAPPADTCIDGHFVQLDLSRGKVGLRAGLLRRQNRRNARFRRLLGSRRGINGSLSGRHERLKFFDLARGHDVGVALLQLGLGAQFILRLFQSPLRLLELALAGQDVRLGRYYPGLHFYDVSTSLLAPGFLSRAVKLEQTVALFYLFVVADIHLRYPAADFSIDRDGPEQRSDVG